MSKTQNYKLTIAYHGARYCGWQRQPDQISIQETIETTLTRMWGGTDRITIHSAGRTDTGVHALGQVAHFTAPAKFRERGILRNALNANLPDDIRILQAIRVPADFHSRFSAVGKTYHYQLFCREMHDPMELGRSWQMRRQLNLAMMREAAEHFLGRHDFASFASNPGYERENTVRTIHNIRFVKQGPRITLKFHGDGFLYRMVRNLTGAIVRAGDGRLTPAEIHTILTARNRSSAPPPAPAHGLYLVKVFY
ncbi:MAG: tRNA pseudouridine(38-40) synthase TruA [Verrucomicrobiota bacterium]